MNIRGSIRSSIRDKKQIVYEEIRIGGEENRNNILVTEKKFWIDG
jgi:hypothetical protein